MFFDFREADRFHAGELGRFLVFSHQKTGKSFWIERQDDGKMFAYIPVGRGTPDDDPYDIRMALNRRPELEFSIEGTYYRVKLNLSSDVYRVFKSASNHLNWLYLEELEKRYSETSPKEFSESTNPLPKIPPT
jgi:hypothetical protein